tara:strand:- start:2306 stop:2680 length:375 start_codon:yes stop_codon:yes gene_type:complete
MAYSTTIKAVVGDTHPELNFTLTDSNTAASGKTLNPEDPTTFAPINLTGATVRVRIRKIGTTNVLSTITCSNTGPSDGKCAMVFTSSTFAEAGFYEGEIEITKADSNIQTINDLIKFNVRDDFD